MVSFEVLLDKYNFELTTDIRHHSDRCLFRQVVDDAERIIADKAPEYRNLEAEQILSRKFGKNWHLLEESTTYFIIYDRAIKERVRLLNLLSQPTPKGKNARRRI